MKTTGVRLYNARDLRVETFDLPEVGEGEVLMRVVSDSLCASTYKAVIQISDKFPNVGAMKTSSVSATVLPKES